MGTGGPGGGVGGGEGPKQDLPRSLVVSKSCRYTDAL